MPAFASHAAVVLALFAQMPFSSAVHQQIQGELSHDSISKNLKNKYHLLAIAMPDGAAGAKNFVQSLLGSAENGIAEVSPGVPRDELDVQSLMENGTICREYRTSGFGDKGEINQRIAGEVATTLAHRNAVDTFLAGDADYAIIFEDDAVLDLQPKDFQKIAQSKNASFLDVMDYMLSKMPKGFHEVNLGRCQTLCHRQKNIVQVSSKLAITKAVWQFCSHAYLMSREGAEMLSALLSKDICAANDKMKIRNREYM